jgi:hypothetical protein
MDSLPNYVIELLVRRTRARAALELADRETGGLVRRVEWMRTLAKIGECFMKTHGGDTAHACALRDGLVTGALNQLNHHYVARNHLVNYLAYNNAQIQASIGGHLVQPEGVPAGPPHVSVSIVEPLGMLIFSESARVRDELPGVSEATDSTEGAEGGSGPR